MSNELDRIVSMALVALPDDAVPTEQEIHDIIQRLTLVFAVSAEVKDAALRQVLARRLVRMDTGFAVAESHTPWVDARRPEIDPFYWSRYRLMLQKEWAPNVLTTLDRTTDEILDLTGNPKDDTTWKRRGLVMGDVQSGKTATYSALICKAADAGYRIVILLTGTIENLRRQTQERIDTGFVGFDSSERFKPNSRDVSVGVGLLDGRRKAAVFTSSHSDFVASKVDSGLTFDALREPAIFVIKKNTKILDNLKDWIRRYNSVGSDGAINKSTLVIDDEADNASIDTSDDSSDPTKVNAGIRGLLTMFRQTTYVGFTATPFANIFVNPDSQEDMLGDDLFPRDFIYTLNSPSNYFGPRKVFGDEPGRARPVRSIADMEDALPERHKSHQAVTKLPGTLLDALRAFCIANAIMDLRLDQRKHRSMLVNVSQFTNVQDQVESLVHDELEKYKTAIRNFSQLPVETALEDPVIKALHAAWLKEYDCCGHEWKAVQRALHNAVLPITTKAVNQRTGPRALDYKAHKENGLRVVAVGGNSLSRGLTLEGLVISYFRRSTKMYDTLLQMGRWFGYRPNYEDLCRVWLPDESTQWYGHICDATEELRGELKRMFNLGMTPKDFGLAVRAHPDSLLVTARNKMRTAAELTRIVSLNMQAFESVELSARREAILNNFRCVNEFIAPLAEQTPPPNKGAWLIQGVKAADVAALLRDFQVPATEFRFQPQAIADLLQNHASDELKDWDVVIPRGEEATVELGGQNVASQRRGVRFDEAQRVFVISGEKRRVGSRGVEKAGLSDEQIRAAENDARKQAKNDALEDGEEPPTHVSVADKYYRANRKRPLLIIHSIHPKAIEGQRWQLPEGCEGKLVAIGLSFPKLNDETKGGQVKYKINLVKAREVLAPAMEIGDDVEPMEVGS